MSKFLPLIYLCLLCNYVNAQDFEYGKYDGAAMIMTKYDKDTSAHAVVLREFGKANISSNDGIPLIFEYHVKVKILDSKGFNQGDVVIYLYKSDNDRFETVDDIEGTTFYKDENGVMQHADLDKSKVYRETVDKHHEKVKFALPNLREGCVIEYKYTLSSPYHYNFHSWEFQSDIPKIYSEYEAHIPAIYNYNIALRGPYKLSVNKPELERDCFSYYGTKADCTKMTLAMNDMPAFIEEDYMTSPANFKSAVYFELAELTDENGVKRKITKEWKDADYEIKTDEGFGSQLKKRDYFKDYILPVVAGMTDSLQKAKAVYAYMQKWFKWNHNYAFESTDGIKKAFESHTGNVADINIALVDALNEAGVNTDAVGLSTRNNGLINKLYPVLSDFDYVVAKANIAGKYYLLDATDPLLPFGLLPLRCINDQGRVFSLNKPSYWIDMVSTKKRSETTALDLTLQDNGKIKGTVTIYSSGYAAYEKRLAIKKFNSVDEYVENLDESMTILKILKSEVLALDSIDSPLTEKYEIEIDANNKLDAGSLVFNPAFWNHTTKNPFKLSERTYPVDLGSASNNKLVLTLRVSEGFTVVSQPTAVALSLPNNGGQFLSNIEMLPGSISYSQAEQFNKAIYSSQEYPYIKELYNKMIQAQTANLVFKKKL